SLIFWLAEAIPGMPTRCARLRPGSSLPSCWQSPTPWKPNESRSSHSWSPGPGRGWRRQRRAFLSHDNGKSPPPVITKVDDSGAGPVASARPLQSFEAVMHESIRIRRKPSQAASAGPQSDSPLSAPLQNGVAETGIEQPSPLAAPSTVDPAQPELALGQATEHRFGMIAVLPGATFATGPATPPSPPGSPNETIQRRPGDSPAGDGQIA